MSRSVEFFDTTLRDGMQSEGISYSVEDKLAVATLLDTLGVDYIEAGTPFSNPKDGEFFARMKSRSLNHARLVAFGGVAHSGVSPENDENIRALAESGAPVISLCGKVWDRHVTAILSVSLEENLEMIKRSTAYLTALGKEVFFDAEGFFDAYLSNREYALSCLSFALEGGATRLSLCDTNGGTLPSEIGRIVADVKKTFPDVKIAIHCHDDIGCAVASSMEAVFNGADQVQGTLIGFGERTGNADLATLAPNLVLKCGYFANMDLESLRPTARAVAELSNMRIRHNHPYIGKYAFAHKGGMHVDGIQKLDFAFEHINPALVGNERRILLSEVSGRSTVLPRIKRFVPDIDKKSPELAAITAVLKDREFFGYQYEGADASFELLVKKELGLFKPHFKTVMYAMSDNYPAQNGVEECNAMVKIEVDGKTEFTCDTGIGPINALDRAMRRAITIFYPDLKRLQFLDFKVRVIECNSSSESKVRVLVESALDGKTFTTIGVSCNIIEAGFIALVESYEYALSRNISDR